jgi:hypothetical protein
MVANGLCPSDTDCAKHSYLAGPRLSENFPLARLILTAVESTRVTTTTTLLSIASGQVSALRGYRLRTSPLSRLGEVLNMRRLFWLLLPLFTALLAPTGAWPASVSQNLAITITAATQLVSFSPASLTFAPQNIGTSSAAQTVTMTNTGNVSFPLSSVAISGTNAGDFTETNNCPNSLAVSATCQIAATFTPVSAGTRTASLVVSATGGGTYTVALSGAGVTPTVSAFYVATNGSDSNPGTLAAPFATLGKCQTAMRNSGTIKTCYIRAGTYNGSGVGYNTVTITTYFSVNAALYLTSADNGETWSYYPPDGADTAIFDGNSGTVASNPNPTTACPQNVIGTGVQYGAYVDGTSNVIIDGLQFQGFCFSAMTYHWGNDSIGGCYPTFSIAQGTGNIFRNNIVHDIFSATSRCQNDFIGGTVAINSSGGNTVSHNSVYNVTGMGIALGGNPGGVGTTSNATIDHNYVYHACAYYHDCGGIYEGKDTSASNVQVLYNYITTMGDPTKECNPTTLAALTPGTCVHGFYNDDGMAGVTRKGNIVTGEHGSDGGDFFMNGGNISGGLAGNTDTGDISDIGPTGTATSYSASVWTINNTTGTGAISWKNNIIIANSASCVTGFSAGCALNPNGASATIGPNDYWNYGSGGNTWLNSAATSGGDTTPNNVDAFGNATTRCPSANGFQNVNSWAYFIPSGNAVFGSPVNFPAQPAGWGTPGFWGPVGYVLPHNGQGPSYGPTC